MNLIANILTFIVISLLTGLTSAWYLIENGPSFTAYQEGPWQTWSSVGKSIADPYTRAHITRSGRLPVMAKSVLYFRTVRDSAGRKIDADCDYVVTGEDPVGQWWSLAAYDGVGNLMSNPAARYAFNASDIMRTPTGSFRISLSRAPTPGNWLPIESDYQVQLILRLHLEPAESRVTNIKYNLPEIRRAACH